MSGPLARCWKPAPHRPDDFLAAFHPGGLSRPHVHEEWQFAVAEGPGSAAVGSRPRSPVGTGEIVVIAPGDVHAESSQAGAPVQWQLLFVTEAAVSALLMRERSAPSLQSGVIADRRAAEGLRSLLRQSAARLAGDVFCSRIGAWVGELFATHAARTTEAGEPHHVMTARRYLRERVPESVTLPAAAAAAGITPWYLARTFSRVVGLPPISYHLQLRLARARRLLSEGLTVTAVAYECGFADQSHLGRRFKEIYQLTPGAFQMQAAPARGGIAAASVATTGAASSAA